MNERLIFNRNKLKEEIAEMKANKYQLIADCNEESEDDNGEN